MRSWRNPSSIDENAYAINNGSGQQQPMSTDLLQQINQGQNVLFSARLPQNGFPGHFYTSHSINPLPTMETTSNGNASFHLEPVTPVRNLNNPSAVMVDLNGEKDEGECPTSKGTEFCTIHFSSQQKIGEDMKLPTCQFSSQPKTGENKDLLTNQVHPSIIYLETMVPSSRLQPIESLNAAYVTRVDEIKNSGCGIDLNKTPQRKARKRKHIPKVLKDGDAKKTAKPVVPKQSANQEQPLPKRKYTRRKGLKPSVNCSVNDLADNNLKASATSSADLGDPASLSKEPRRQSCKRYLHFDLESQDEDKCPKLPPVQTDKSNDSNVGAKSTSSVIWNSDCQTAQTRDCTDIGHSNGSESNVQLLKGIEKSLVGSAFQITFHQNEKLKDYLLLPEMLSPSLLTEAVNKNVETSALVNGRDSNHNQMSQHAYDHVEEAAEIECIAQQNMSGNGNTNVVLTESNQERKRIEREIVDDYDLQSIYFPQIYKKKRTIICKRSVLSSIGVTPSILDGHCVVENENSRYPIAGEKQQTQQEFAGSQIEVPINHKILLDDVLGLQIERRIKKKRNASYRIRRLPTMNIASGENDKLHRKANSSFCVPQSCVEALNAENNAKMRTKKRTKKERTLHHPNSMSNNIQLVPMQHETYGSRSHPPTTSVMSSPSQALDLNSYPLEDLILKFIHLSINGGDKTDMDGTLVPYGGEKAMAPYERVFTKRRRPRAKVELDAETNRVWKLLMWKESSDGAEETDVKEKEHWEEQRRVFQGRAESFIARMRLVQGDRRFSQWKGSVVDSVIGVFLTQNVSDHLSSSAFMDVAARFPVRSQNKSRGPDVEVTGKSAEDEKSCVLDSDYNIKTENIKSCHCSVTLHEAEHIENEIPNLSESYGSSMEGDKAVYSNAKQLESSESGQEMCHESPENITSTSVVLTESTNLEGSEDIKGPEEFVSSQGSAVSSLTSTDSSNFITDRILSSSESNSETDCLVDCRVFSSFTELLQSQIAGSNRSKEPLKYEDRGVHFDETSEGVTCQSDGIESEKRNSSIGGIVCLNDSCPTIYPSNTYYPQDQEMPCSGHQLHSSPGSSGTMELESVEASGDESRCSLLPNSCESTEVDYIYSTEKIMDIKVKTVTESTIQQSKLYGDQIAETRDPYAHKSKHPSHELGTHHEENPVTCNNLSNEKTGDSLGKEALSSWSESHFGQKMNSPQKSRDGSSELGMAEVIGFRNIVEESAQMQNSRTQQDNSNLPKRLGETLEVSECSSLVDKQQPVERTGIESNTKEVSSSKNMSNERTDNTTQGKKERRSKEKKDFDWDSLRKQVCQDAVQKERSSDRMDSVDWEAVRLADEHEISNTIRARGMNNRLAERIKNFLNRLVRDHGSINLEWLRDVPPDKAKDYLLSIWGLGLKSVECVRLLTLHHLAFPVDTNVGRICVRLGWVPLQPLPESLQLHLLEMYPVLESIQKYLWPRLCTLDQNTLYELHYQMITFGKVFCTKKQPNCNACPMRAECRHFASAFASARLALPGPEEKSIINSSIPVTAEVPVTPEAHLKLINDPLPLPPLEGQPNSEAGLVNKSCVPIVEEPPDHECLDSLQKETHTSDTEIEDYFPDDDPDEIPTIKLNVEELVMSVQNYVQQNNIELQDGDMSKALVALTLEAASIPTPKLKNVSRLRTEHQVYELPDSHPLLAGLDRREPDDPCSYLLAIWTPGETAKSTQPPEFCCNSQESGNMCDKETCFTCNSVREAQTQTVRGTILIPCRTAMRGSFPLNGTYFQVNEVFADHDSSHNPIDVPRAWIWNLPRRTVYFGTSIPTIFKGLTTEGIQHCFWRGYVCVRGIDWKTRAPRPLSPRLHYPASKAVKTRKPAETKVQ